MHIFIIDMDASLNKRINPQVAYIDAI